VVYSYGCSNAGLKQAYEKNHNARGVARSKTVGWTEGASRTHGERGALADNGGLEAEPPAGSRGRAPGQGFRGQSPREAESILPLDHPNEGQNLPL